MEKEEIVKLSVSYRNGYYNYDKNEFEAKEDVLRAYSEYMQGFEGENFDIDSTDEDFKLWLDEYNTYYIDAYELTAKKENGYYINYYVTEKIINDKKMYQLYSNIYALYYQNEEDVIITTDKWDDIIQYIADEEDVIIEYNDKCYYPNNEEE